MNTTEAYEEFQRRHESWSITEFEKEMDAGFPNLQFYKAGLPYDTYQVMQELDRTQQRALALALVKRSGKTREEEALCRRVFLIGSNMAAKRAREVAERRLAGEKVKLVSVPQLRKAVNAKFAEAFGGRYVKGQDIGDGGVVFETRCRGWIVSAHFYFGRGIQDKFIQYGFFFDSEAKVPSPTQPEILRSVMRLANWQTWLCFGKWENIREEDMEPMAACAAKYCVFYFDAVPELLAGFEAETISPDGGY
jgi:hypothetical protein